MDKLRRGLLKGTLFVVVFVTANIITSGTVSACCDDDPCGSGYCVNAPSCCGEAGCSGEGVCVSGYETCSGSSNSSPCPSGEVCVGGICQPGSGDDPGDNRYGYQSCPAGQTPAGGVGYLMGAGFDCMTGAGCDGWFPSRRNPDSECGGVNRANCIVNQLCCAPGLTVECGNIISSTQILPGDVRYPGYRNCPVGGTARVFANNRAGTDYNDDIYCRSGCRCVYPCGSPQRPGTQVVATQTNLGQYSRLNQSDQRTNCRNWLDPFSQDDIYIRWEPTNIIWRQYWWSEDPECERRNCSELITEYYVRTYCYDMMTTTTCDEACTLTAPSNLAFNPATGILSWSGATSDASSTVRIYISLASEPESTVTGFCTYVVARVIFPKQPPETWRLASRSLH